MDIKITIDKLEILSGKKVEYVKELSRGKTFVFKTIARKNEVIQCFLLDTYENLIKHYKNVCIDPLAYGKCYHRSLWMVYLYNRRN